MLAGMTRDADQQEAFFYGLGIWGRNAAGPYRYA